MRLWLHNAIQSAMRRTRLPDSGWQPAPLPWQSLQLFLLSASTETSCPMEWRCGAGSQHGWPLDRRTTVIPNQEKQAADHF